MSVAIPSLRGAIAVPEWAKNELWRKSRVVPSLDLRFADLKSLVDATTGTNLVTFSRASGGTYVGSDGLIKTAAVNEPRFTHDPVTGESLGLLIEEQRVNELPWSENFADPQYIPVLSAIGATNLPAPDGTNTATLLLETNTTGEHYIQDTLPPGKTGTVTHSVFVKAAGRNFASLRMVHIGESISTSSARVDLTTGQITFTEGLGQATSVRAFPNGWYRVSVAVTLTGANTTYGFRVHTVSSATGNINYAGDPTKGILIWGAQSEDGAFPTSYIKNAGTTLGVTRQPDLCQLSGSNFSSWYNQSEGTILTEAAVANTSVNRFITSFSDGTIGEEISLYWAAAFNSLVNDGGVSQANSFGGTVLTGVKEIHSFAFKVNDFQGYANGVALSTDTSGTLPTVDRLTIGSRSNSTFIANGTISRLTFWPQRLSNEILQVITQ